MSSNERPVPSVVKSVQNAHNTTDIGALGTRSGLEICSWSSSPGSSPCLSGVRSGNIGWQDGVKDTSKVSIRRTESGGTAGEMSLSGVSRMSVSECRTIQGVQ